MFLVNQRFLFRNFLLCCPSQMSARRHVPSQVATHQGIGRQLWAGETPDLNPGLQHNSLARYHWATTPPHWATTPPRWATTPPQITVPIYRNKSPQKISVDPCRLRQVIIIRIWLDFYEDDRLPWVRSSIHIQCFKWNPAMFTLLLDLN
jgi:hypothetical protein